MAFRRLRFDAVRADGVSVILPRQRVLSLGPEIQEEQPPDGHAAPSTENWISKVLPLPLLGPMVFQTPVPLVSRTLTVGGEPGRGVVGVEWLPVPTACSHEWSRATARPGQDAV